MEVRRHGEECLSSISWTTSLEDTGEVFSSYCPAVCGKTTSFKRFKWVCIGTCSNGHNCGTYDSKGSKQPYQCLQCGTKYEMNSPGMDPYSQGLPEKCSVINYVCTAYGHKTSSSGSCSYPVTTYLKNCGY